MPWWYSICVPLAQSNLLLCLSLATHPQVLLTFQGCYPVWLLIANLNWSIPNTPSLLSSPLECNLSVLANNCGTDSVQDLHIYTIPPLILAAKTASTRQSYLVADNERSLCWTPQRAAKCQKEQERAINSPKSHKKPKNQKNQKIKKGKKSQNRPERAKKA